MSSKQEISARIIEDSISKAGIRLTTLQLTYPRFIHSELMTHRVFSRNAMSSRAVPVAKMLEQVRNDPAMPIHWGKNQPGMQAREEFTDHFPLWISQWAPEGARLVDQVGIGIPVVQGAEICVAAPEWVTAEQAWREAAKNAADVAEAMSNAGLHKQVVNRILEPFQWMHTIVTATEWDNFFELRLHEDAEPNFQALAQCIHDAMLYNAAPKALMPGEWHLPYVTQGERELFRVDLLLKASSARCARVSYLNHDGTAPDIEKDVDLHNRLVGSKPMHASPVEHQARPDIQIPLEDDGFKWRTPYLHGNFRGWLQHRKFLEHDRDPLNTNI